MDYRLKCKTENHKLLEENKKKLLDIDLVMICWLGQQKENKHGLHQKSFFNKKETINK